MDPRPAAAEQPPSKRPRSPTAEYAPIASKVARTGPNHLQINYLARQYTETLPLVSTDDNMPAILRLVNEYDGVLHRHESIAGNLGACPLGPILIKRFERLFDGPPRVLKSHGKDAPTVTWLDVVEFAKNKPEQFNLEKTRDGVRVCQFYTKQCRVEISEEDYVLIASGMPQKMIPPQPIIEDEEKELGALEILERNLQQIIQMADQVSARARQLNHRLKNRRTAIVSRRENDAALHAAHTQRQPRSTSPAYREANGSGPMPTTSNGHSRAHSPPTGFVAVNAHRPSGLELPGEESPIPSSFLFSHPNTDNITIINGTSVKGASPTTRAELMKKFFSTADRQPRVLEETSASPSRPSSRPSRPRVSDPGEYSLFAASASTPGAVAIPGTPSALLPPPKSNHHERDDGGPFKLEMVARMEELQRGERVLPPCDRCRRLQMDCLKNLTACMGCTKKHAKCSWKEVREEELRNLPPSSSVARDRASEDSVPLHDPSLSASSHNPSAQSSGAERAVPGREITDRAPPSNPHIPRGDSAPEISHPTRDATGSLSQAPSPRRAMSEAHANSNPGPHHPHHHHHPHHSNHDRRIYINRNKESVPDDDENDPDASQRLMQAIMDTVDQHTRASAAANSKDQDKGDVGGDRDPERKTLQSN